MSDNSVPMMKLTGSDYERFHRLASGVLKSRTRAHSLRGAVSALNRIVAGCIPIAGVAFFDWSATNWMVFLVAGSWMGILCDYLRLSLLRQQIDSWCDHVIDDTFVSVVGEAIRKGKDEVVREHLPKKPSYDTAVLVDLVFCTVSSLVILISLSENLNAEVLGRPFFITSMISFLTYRLVMAIWEIIDIRRNQPRQAVVKLALGLRGAAMFVTMFIVLIVSDKIENARTATQVVVYGINRLLVLMGLLELLGVWLVMKENRWLRRYLDSGNSQELLIAENYKPD